jgi:hypothetical protein
MVIPVLRVRKQVRKCVKRLQACSVCMQQELAHCKGVVLRDKMVQVRYKTLRRSRRVYYVCVDYKTEV